MPTTPKDSQINELFGTDRRRSKRLSLAFQIEVTGRESSGADFRDIATTEDINEHGCRFALQRELRRGEIVNIRVVSRNASKPHSGESENTSQRFEIVWVEASMQGWAYGARKQEGGHFWPVSFPAKA